MAAPPPLTPGTLELLASLCQGAPWDLDEDLTSEEVDVLCMLQAPSGLVESPPPPLPVLQRQDAQEAPPPPSEAQWTAQSEQDEGEPRPRQRRRLDSSEATLTRQLHGHFRACSHAAADLLAYPHAAVNFAVHHIGKLEATRFARVPRTTAAQYVADTNFYYDMPRRDIAALYSMHFGCVLETSRLFVHEFGCDPKKYAMDLPRDNPLHWRNIPGTIARLASVSVMRMFIDNYSREFILGKQPVDATTGPEGRACCWPGNIVPVLQYSNEATSTAGMRDSAHGTTDMAATHGLRVHLVPTNLYMVGANPFARQNQHSGYPGPFFGREGLSQPHQDQDLYSPVIDPSSSTSPLTGQESASVASPPSTPPPLPRSDAPWPHVEI
jgi:hypothetical protein